MKRKIDAKKLSELISTHTHFKIETENPRSSIKVQGTFDKVFVDWHGYPVVYLVLCDGGIYVNIRHIQKIQFESDGWVTKYYLTCLEYTDGQPEETIHIIECM